LFVQQAQAFILCLFFGKYGKRVICLDDNIAARDDEISRPTPDCDKDKILYLEFPDLVPDNGRTVFCNDLKY